MNKLLTTREVCKLLGMKAHHVNQLYLDGILDKMRINPNGKKPSYLWLSDKVESYMQKNPQIYGENPS